MDESYLAQVEAGRAGFDRGEGGNWDLARLTFDVCGPPIEEPLERFKGNPGKQTLIAWSEDVREGKKRRFSAATAAKYRALWAYRISPDYRDESWTEAWTLLIQKGVGKPDKAPADLAAAFRAASPEDRAAALSQPEAAPAIAKAIVAPGTRERVHAEMDALAEAEAEKTVGPLWSGGDTATEGRQRKAREHSPALTEAAGHLGGIVAEGQLARAVDDLVAALNAFSGRVEEYLPQTTRAALDGALFLRMALGDVREPLAHALESLNRLERAAETGQTDLDAFLDGVLKGSG